MRTRKLGLVAIVVGVTLAAACGHDKAQPKPLAADEAARLLVDRNWLDHMPERADERLFVYRFTPSMGGGVFQDRTLFHGTFELFRFEVHGDELRFDLPHKHQKVLTHYTIKRVDKAPFDLQLTIDHSPRGPKVYYGMSQERAGDADVTVMLERALGGR
jgi:hypothetical protein